MHTYGLVSGSTNNNDAWRSNSLATEWFDIIADKEMQSYKLIEIRSGRD